MGHYQRVSYSEFDQRARGAIRTLKREGYDITVDNVVSEMEDLSFEVFEKEDLSFEVFEKEDLSFEVFEKGRERIEKLIDEDHWDDPCGIDY